MTDPNADPSAVQEYECLQTMGGGYVTIWYGAGKWWNFACQVSPERAAALTRALARGEIVDGDRS